MGCFRALPRSESSYRRHLRSLDLCRSSQAPRYFRRLSIPLLLRALSSRVVFPVPFATATFVGTLTSTVLQNDPTNPLGGLTYTYLLANVPGSPGAIDRLTVADFNPAPGLTDVDYVRRALGRAPLRSSIAALTVRRSASRFSIRPLVQELCSLGKSATCWSCIRPIPFLPRRSPTSSTRTSPGWRVSPPRTSSPSRAHLFWPV